MNVGKAQTERRIVRWMRRHEWNYETPRNGLRHRLYSLASDRRPWWDWGHRLMALTGSDFGGSWSEPSPPTWWYRKAGAKRMWRTGYPRSTFQVVADYDEFKRLTEGLNEDQMYAWSAMCVNGDRDLILGHRYWGGAFYGLSRAETVLLRRYLRMWRRLDWFGLRSWLYSQGLHAAVHAKKPRTCQAVPPRDSGGYSHWYCGQPRRHDGLHRFRNYEWGPVGDEEIGPTFAPAGDDA